MKTASKKKQAVANFTTRRVIQRPPQKLKMKKDVEPNAERTIRDDENLSTEDFMDRLRINYPTFRDMLDDGLPVRVFGKYRRISGREFNRWAETLPLLRPDKKQSKRRPATTTA